MNLILKDSKNIDYYTYLDVLFKKVPQFQEYTYFISDLEYNYCEDERLHKDNFFISGKELFEIINENSIQFIWAVLSAFKEKPIIPVNEIPYADGNPGFWVESPVTQLKDADFEIVCFDSSFTLFIGVDNSLYEGIKRVHPDVKDLNLENRNRKKGGLHG